MIFFWRGGGGGGGCVTSESHWCKTTMSKYGHTHLHCIVSFVVFHLTSVNRCKCQVNLGLLW